MGQRVRLNSTSMVVWLDLPAIQPHAPHHLDLTRNLIAFARVKATLSCVGLCNYIVRAWTCSLVELRSFFVATYATVALCVAISQQGCLTSISCGVRLACTTCGWIPVLWLFAGYITDKHCEDRLLSAAYSNECTSRPGFRLLWGVCTMLKTCFVSNLSLWSLSLYLILVAGR